MGKKLIFFDIDGTIISSKGMLPSTKEAIRAARANGHICVINTGRSKALVGPKIRELVEFDGYVMGCGSMIEFRDEVLYHHTWDASVGQRVIDGLRRHRIDAVLEGTETNFCEPFERLFTPAFRNYILQFREEGYGSFEEAPGNFDKFFCFPETTEHMYDFLGEFADIVDGIPRERGYFEVIPKGITKETGMRMLAEKLGIPMEDTVAIGDGPNDLPMLRCAHTAIVMGNAPAEVKRIAHHVTTDVDDDGIQNALRWLGLF